MQSLLNHAKAKLLQHPRLFAAILQVLHRDCRIGVASDGRFLYIKKGNREVRLAVRHAVYSVDVVREFDYYFFSVEPETLLDGTQVADFSVSKGHRIPGIDAEFVFPGLPEGNETNNAYLDALPLKPGDTLIDGGAYAGLTAYLFARALGPTGRVIAIEADPENFRILTENIQRSARDSIAKVDVMHAALWKVDGTLNFCSESNMGSTVSAHARRSHAPVSVRAVTLDHVVDQFGLDRVDFVKLDIEGAEYEVVPALGQFLTRFRPQFIIEIHRDSRGAIDVAGVARAFANFGYECSNVVQSKEQQFPLLHARPLGTDA